MTDVAMIVHAYYLKDARVRRYAELLAAAGHRVDVLCLREGSEPRHEVFAGVDIYRVNTARQRGGMAQYVIEYLSSFLRFFLLLSRLYLGGRRYRAVHVHNMPNFLVFCALIPRLFGARVILDTHDVMPEVYRSKYGIGADHWLTRLMRVEEWASIRFASAVIAANHTFRDILARRVRKDGRYSVFMNKPSPIFFAQAHVEDYHPDTGFHIIYIGTLAERYGVEIGLQAVAKLHRENAIPGLRFSIIPKIRGEGDYAGKLRQEAAELGLGDVLRFLDPVPHDQMPDVIRSADLLLYTPVPDVHMDIAISLKIPEVIAVGRPIVSSRLTVNLRYFGEDALFMFEPGNVDACAARILDVYRDPEAVRRAIRHGREKLAEIDWQAQERDYLALVTG